MIFDDLSDRVARIATGLRIMRAALVLLGSLLAAVAGAFLGQGGTGFTVPQILVFVGSAVAFIGGLIAVWSEEDPREAIDNARRKLVEAERYENDARKRLEALKEYRRATEQLKSLYMLFSTCRGTLEQALTHAELDEQRLIENCVQGCRHDLRVALDFEMNDYWTICIYKRELNDNGQPQLRCISHLRSVDCEIKNARIWPIGVGVAGAALAKNDEVVEPDVFSGQAGTTYLPTEELSRPPDDEKYRSLFLYQLATTSTLGGY